MKYTLGRFIVFCFVLSLLAQTGSPQRPADELAAYNEPPSRLRGMIEKFDLEGLARCRLTTHRESCKIPVEKVISNK